MEELKSMPIQPELLSQSETSLILMVYFSESAQECRISPTGHTQDTKNTFSKLLQLHADCYLII